MRTVLISVDTLRSDIAIECGISDLFDQVFTNYFSTCNWTLPCHSALLSGLSVGHGCQWEWGYPETSEETQILCETLKNAFNPVTTLAEELKSRKIPTYAVVGGGFVSSWFGLDRGFDTWNEDKNYPLTYSIDTLSSIPDNSFVFIHDWFVHDYFQDTDWDLHFMRTEAFMQPYEMKKEDLDRGKEAYKNRVRFIRDRLKRILKHYKNDRVLLVGDHGEGFLESGSTVHHGVYSDLLHREVSNPPLMTLNCNFNLKTYAPIFDCDILSLILEGSPSDTDKVLCSYSFRGTQKEVLLRRN